MIENKRNENCDYNEVQTVEKNTKRKTSLNLKIVLTYIFSFLALNLVILIFLGVFPDVIEDETRLNNILVGLNLLWYVGLLIALVIIARIYLFVNQWAYFKSNPRRSFSLIVVGLVGVFLVSILVNLIFAWLGIELDPQNQEALEALMQAGPWAVAGLVVFAGFLAPITEEIVFRKGVYGMVHHKYGNVAAIIINSFFFGLVHVLGDIVTDFSSIINIVPYFALGLFISYIYYRSAKIIYVPIIIHMAYNLILLTSLLFMI